jgi:hypothetical protein
MKTLFQEQNVVKEKNVFRIQQSLPISSTITLINHLFETSWDFHFVDIYYFDFVPVEM